MLQFFYNKKPLPGFNPKRGFYYVLACFAAFDKIRGVSGTFVRYLCEGACDRTCYLQQKSLSQDLNPKRGFYYVLACSATFDKIRGVPGTFVTGTFVRELAT